MVLVLVLGDLHIPHRTHDLPPKFKKLLAPAGKISQVLCTGNVCDRETLEYLRGIVTGGGGGGGDGAGMGEVYVVKGDYDELPSLPSSLTITHASPHTSLRIGLIHGHQSLPLGSLDALSAIARQMDVDVLVSGATHGVQAVEYDGRFFLNPGSATGAWTGHRSASSAPAPLNATATTDPSPPSASATPADRYRDPPPSFALMDIQGTVIVTYVYQFIDGDVKVEKVEWRKPDLYVGGAKSPGIMPQSIPSPVPPRAVSPQAGSGW